MAADEDPRQQVIRFVQRAHRALDRVDYYQLLGIARDATGPEIRKAYYRLAARLHPDLHVEALDATVAGQLTSVYSRIVEGYRILSHGRRREQYDAWLAEGNLRWDARAHAQQRLRKQEVVANASARKFYKLGHDALRHNNAKAAVMNFRLALSMEPENLTIQDDLAEAEKRLAQGKGE